MVGKPLLLLEKERASVCLERSIDWEAVVIQLSTAGPVMVGGVGGLGVVVVLLEQLAFIYKAPTKSKAKKVTGFIRQFFLRGNRLPFIFFKLLNHKDIHFGLFHQKQQQYFRKKISFAERRIFWYFKKGSINLF